MVGPTGRGGTSTPSAGSPQVKPPPPSQSPPLHFSSCPLDPLPPPWDGDTPGLVTIHSSGMPDQSRLLRSQPMEQGRPEQEWGKGGEGFLLQNRGER